MRVQCALMFEASLHMFCRYILQQLGSLGSYEQQSLCRQQLEELAGAIRFCKYERDRQGGADESGVGFPTSLDGIQVGLHHWCWDHISFCKS